MTRRLEFNIPLNRVEGDLEIRVVAEGGRIVDAWSSGTLFRGFERMLVGRSSLDGLVMTPRICGICSVTHLTAAALALDQASGVVPPPNAVRLRNVALLTETIQSDIRQSLLMYMVDFASAGFSARPWYMEARARYAPLRGERCVAAIKETKHLLEIIALIGGQWPHTSFMVPGGVVYAPPLSDLGKARHVLKAFRRWYEDSVLGCTLARWRGVDSLDALETWLDESAAHRESDLGCLLRHGRDVGLHRIGVSHGRYLSYGALSIPEDSKVTGPVVGSSFIPAGFLVDGQVRAFDQARITEDHSHAWYEDSGVPVHPMAGTTEPVASGAEGRRYSWSKAPRYDGLAAETGPLAESLMAGDPLFLDLVSRDGGSALTRQVARLVRPARQLEVLDDWLDELCDRHAEPFYRSVPSIQEGEGIGLTQAARGALGHWLRIESGRIAHYQIITPTAWNGSPRDTGGVRGAWEEALLGTPIDDPDEPLLAGMVVRSFDPCLVCTVHLVGAGRRRLMV